MARAEASVERVAATSARRGSSALRRGDGRFALLMVLPTLVVVLGVTAYPWVYSVWLSLTNFNAAFADDAKFVGLANYTKFLSDPIFQESLVHTLHYAFLTVAGGTLLGLGMALVLNE